MWSLLVITVQAVQCQARRLCVQISTIVAGWSASRVGPHRSCEPGRMLKAMLGRMLEASIWSVVLALARHRPTGSTITSLSRLLWSSPLDQGG
jgi:hypothetical protein